VQDSRRPLLRFNMSHTRGLVAWTFSIAHACGVDVEQVREDFDVDELIDVVCSSTERRALDELSGRARTEQFYRMWCLKEALLKGCGLGLTDNLPGVIVQDLGEGRYRAADPLCRVVGDSHWYLHSAVCGTGEHMLALAYEQGSAGQPRVALEYLVPDAVFRDHCAGAADAGGGGVRTMAA
jgi:4'-phosphopantetheinyl transferase